MSDTAISIDRVARMFKRYRNPRYRVMEALGLRLPKNAYDEFWALRDISFTVRRGERVALIGRNGAGKSTLLNIICQRLRPSSGSVTVEGRIQALMELGTGFHPDFTGRENVLSSLAYQGISGAKALALLDEVIDFAELDDFIDQPIKTYSTGMYARLAFSTATAFEPDVLIIDEVLGAGDAYFAAKCTERMHRLTLEMGATVLFVSHDMASVERLCDRAIWIQRGQMHMSGSAREVTKSYHSSVLVQEETRLRARTSTAISRMRGDVKDLHAENLLRVSLVTQSAQLPEGSHPVRRLSLTRPDGVSLEVRPGSPMDNDSTYDAFLFVDQEYSLWSAPKVEGDEMVRCVESTGGKSLQAQAYFKVPVLDRDKPLALEIEHAANPVERLAVEIYDSREPPVYRRLGLLSAEEVHGWRVDRFSIVLNGLAEDSTHGLNEAATVTEILSAAAIPESGQSQTLNVELQPADGLGPVDSGSLDLPTVVREIEGSSLDSAHTTASHAQPQIYETELPYPDKWRTSEAEFVEITPCVRFGSRPQFIFSLGEPITFKIVVDVRADLPIIWLAASFYDQFGGRVCVTVHEFNQGAPCGRHEIYLTLEQPPLRQGEYVGTFELLPEFDFNWEGPGRIPYLSLWNRCVFFKVDEGYRGVIELGLVDVASKATSATLAVARAVTVGGQQTRVNVQVSALAGGHRQ